MRGESKIDDNKLLKVIEKMRIDKIKNFDQLKKFTNEDEGKEMITIYYTNLSVRKVNDWGRDEDTDFYLGLDKSGWITYIQKNHNLAGPFKIIDEKIEQVNDKYVFEYIKSNPEAYDEFISNAKLYL